MFAYASEIEAWLKASGHERAAKREPTETHVAARWWLQRRSIVVGVVASALVIVAIVVATWRLRATAITAERLRVSVTDEGIVASDTDGEPRWRYLFPSAYRIAPIQMGGPSVVVVGGRDPAVYVATAHRYRRSDSVADGGELRVFGVDGTLRQSFSFDDRLTVDGEEFGPPWVVTAVAVDGESASRRIAVAAHHYHWSASMITILDERFQRHGTYVQAGWIEAAHWLAPDRLLIGGFNQGQNGGMVALLDPAALGAPLRIAVMPRTEVNVVSVSRFNRVLVERLPDRIVARTVEVPGSDPADVLYDFTPALDLVRAAHSASYWQVHEALHAQGKLSHDRARCPDRDGPREIRMWEPRSEWRTIKIR